MRVATLVDKGLEAPVFTSFSRLGYDARKRIANWQKIDKDLRGIVILLTGATSGIGRAAAEHLARQGATLVLVGRNASRNQTVVDELITATGNDSITQFPADMGELDQVRALAEHVLSAHHRLDVLIHNAGVLSAERHETSNGTEATVASQVIGPFLLTSLLFDRLEASSPARVLTMSSGGMYTAGLAVSNLEMSADDYKGAEQYARAKRAQVALNEMWADRFGDRGIRFHALHPGWVDTPGVQEALPRFAKIMGRLLRPLEQGIDTLLWLVSGEEALEVNGKFWHDREQRPTHRLPATHKTDTDQQRQKLWVWVTEKSGNEPHSQ